MIIYRIKEKVESYLGEKKRFVFNGSRNQIEEFKGIISAVYPAVFLITLENGSVRSYSYSDLLISNLQIID